MRDEAVAVLGGSGFLGRHLVKRLAERGAVVRVATRHPASAVHLKPMGEVGQIVLVEGNLADDSALADLLRGASAAVNLVGILYESRKGDFERLQARLPGRFATAAKAAGVCSLVQVSAIGADPNSPSMYARTKAAGEAAARDAFPEAAILRPSIIFGPEDSFFNRFASMSRFAPALPLIGGGTNRFQPVYVGDVADAIVACIDRPELGGKTYELGGPATYTFKELLRYLLRVLGRPRPLVNLPFKLAEVQARVLELLPAPPLTRDQLELLKRDNVVPPGALTLADLGVEATPVETVVPRYLGALRGPNATIPPA